VLIEGVGGKFDIGAFAITQAQPTPDQKLDFVARATDGDGDFKTSSFSIGIDGTGPFDDGQVAGVGIALTAASLGGGAEALTEQGLRQALAAAMGFWHGTEQLSALSQVTFHLTDLQGALLGWASGREIWIDLDAAGWGWSLDAAPGRMDLMHALEHELGHMLGFEHSDEGVMQRFLTAGAPLSPASVPMGEAPVGTSTSGLAGASALSPSLVARSPVTTSGLTESPSVVTVFNSAGTLAPASASQISVTPSTGGANFAAAFAAARTESAGPASTSGAGRNPSAFLPPAEGSGHGGFGPSALSNVRPQSAAAATIDRLFGAGPDGLLDVPGAYPPSGWDATEPGRAIEGQFGGDRAAPSDGVIDRLFSDKDSLPAGKEQGAGAAGLGTAVAMMAAGCLVANRPRGREERARLRWKRS
jgi:hypothetical protein